MSGPGALGGKLGIIMGNENASGFTVPDATLIRNNLMITIRMSNGQRTGSFINVTLREYQKAKTSHGDERFIMLVEDHKTFTGHMHANLVMTASTYQMLTCYVQYLLVAHHRSTCSSRSWDIRSPTLTFCTCSRQWLENRPVVDNK